MATAVLENNNPYAKFGLKRRPTYDELIGLINENASLFGPTPDRMATAFKASPEGSFFDGLNYTDRLKEEQERILNKEMRDILLRQNMGNQTMSIARLQNNPSTPSSEPQSLPSGSMAEAGVQSQLEQIRQQQETRRQQTAQAHRGMLPMIQGVMSNIMSLSPARGVAPQTFNINSEDDLAKSRDSDEPKLMTDAEMQTARGEAPTADSIILNSLRFRNPDATETQLTRALNVLSKFKAQQPEQITTSPNNFSKLNNIHGTLAENGFIDEDVWIEYQELTSTISRERGGRKRASLLRDLANHYRDNIYDKFINEIANRPAGSGS